MNLYTAPVDGVYNHKIWNYDGTCHIQQVKVAVLGENRSQYLIRLVLPVGHHRQNEQMRVCKHNVYLHREKPQKAVVDLSGEWWNQ